MSGSIEIVISQDSQKFRQKVKCINDSLDNYGIPRYEPNYNFASELENNNNILFSFDNAPGMDISFTERRTLRSLKTLVIELEFNPHWNPESGSVFFGEPLDSGLLKEVFGEKQSHFILHSDLVGDYVPVYFENRVVPDWFLTNLGSSIRCCNELEEIAHKLKLSLGRYTPNFQILHEQRFDELADDILYLEKFMLLELYNIMLASIKHNLLVSFH